MIIERLHIDGFGIFHNKGISGFKKGVNILYGRNEAGKSTLLDFISMTLFGYPFQTKERRPPLKGGNHGGRIWLRTSKKEPLQIYRTGPERSKPQIIFKNSEHTGDHLLGRLMDYASKDLYRNIYAITLEELKDVEQLEKSGVEDKIFSMGMGLSGVDFVKFESDLEKHAEKYFKPAGKNQVILELAKEIEEKQDEVHKLQKKLDSYNQLNRELEELKKRQSRIDSERSRLRQKEALYSSYSKAYPYFIQYREAEEELSLLGDRTSFPVQLMDDYKELKQKEETLNEKLEECRNEISTLELKVKNTEIDEQLKENIHLLEYLQTNISLYKKALDDQKSLEQEISLSGTGSDEIMSRLGTRFDKKKLLETKGTIELRNKGKSFADKLAGVDSEISRAEDRIREKETALDVNNEKAGNIKKEMTVLEIRDDDTLESARKELADLDTRFRTALSYIQNKSGSSGKLIRQIFAALSIILAGGGIFLAQYNLTAGAAMILAGLTGIGLALFFRGFKSELSESEDPEALNRKMEKLKNSIETFGDMEKKRRELLDNISELKTKVTNENKLLEKLESRKKEIFEEWNNTLNSYNLPSDIPPDTVSDLIGDIETLKEHDRKIKGAQAKIAEISETAGEFEEKVLQARQIGNIPANLHKVHELINQLADTREKCNETERFSQAIDKKKSDIKRLGNELLRIKEKKDKILQKLDAKDEAGLYSVFEKQKKAETLENELKSAEAAIKSICGHDNFNDATEFLDSSNPEEISIKLEGYKQDLQECEKRFSEATTLIGSITQKIEDLLKPDEMFSLQSQVETLKTRLREGTCEWLSTKMALEILSESKQKYEEEKQPAVITTSRDYFKEITGSEYMGLRVSLGEKHVSLQDKSGTSKTVSELSRGTREQLLLALRMGLITEYEKNAEPLPVVLDDVMVNFDPERAKNTVRAIHSFADSRQVLIFTCHPSTVDLFRSFEFKLLEW